MWAPLAFNYLWILCPPVFIRMNYCGPCQQTITNQIAFVSFPLTFARHQQLLQQKTPQIPLQDTWHRLSLTNYSLYHHSSLSSSSSSLCGRKDENEDGWSSWLPYAATAAQSWFMNLSISLQNDHALHAQWLFTPQCFSAHFYCGGVHRAVLHCKAMQGTFLMHWAVRVCRRGWHSNRYLSAEMVLLCAARV